MHIDPFDVYHPRSSVVHGLDPRLKLLLAVLFIIATAMLPDGAWWQMLATFALILGWGWLARLSPWFAPRRSLLALPFTLAALSLIFVMPGPALWQGQLGPWHLRISQSGVLRFASILVRSLLSVQFAILLTATTPYPDLIHALRHLHLPRPFVAIIAFMLRYLFLLADEALRLLRARSARSAGRGPRQGLLWQAKTAGNMAGQLFERSFMRSERVHNAMLARGYIGDLYTLHPHSWQRRDWLAAILALTALLLIHLI